MGFQFNPFTGNLDIVTGTDPAGSTTQVQFNSAGVFGADSNFVWDNTNKRLGIGGAASFSLHVAKAGEAQACFSGWDSVGGTASTSGEILLGTNAAFRGVIHYNANIGDLYFDNTYDSALGRIFFRTRTAGSAVTLLTLAGSTVTLGGSASDTVSFTSTNVTFTADTAVALSGGVNGLNFASDALSIDGTNKRIGIGLNNPTARIGIKGSGTTSSSGMIYGFDSAGTGRMYLGDDGSLSIGHDTGAFSLDARFSTLTFRLSATTAGNSIAWDFYQGAASGAANNNYYVCGVDGDTASAMGMNGGTDDFLFRTYYSGNYRDIYRLPRGTTDFKILGKLVLDDAVNLEVGSTTGSKIGTATSQKLSLWNATPIVQPTTAVAAATFVANTSLIANDSATFDGYTLGQVVKALRNIGILA